MQIAGAMQAEGSRPAVGDADNINLDDSTGQGKEDGFYQLDDDDDLPF